MTNVLLVVLTCADLSRSGVVWCGVVWCGVVWCGVVYSTAFTVTFLTEYGDQPEMTSSDASVSSTATEVTKVRTGCLVVPFCA